MKEVQVKDIVGRMEDFAPKELASEGDPIGLHFGSMDQSVKRVLVSLDVRPETVQEAIDKECDFILAHHPPIFRPIQRFDWDLAQNRMYADIIRHDIKVYAAHTNLDAAEPGLNDWLAEDLGLEDTELMAPQVTYQGKEYGYGRVGSLKEEMTFSDLIDHCKSVFSISHLRYVGEDLNRPVKRVAIMGGSGSSFYLDAVRKEADVYITGDLSYHYGHDIQASGMYAIDPGHYIESVCIDRLSGLIRQWIDEEDWALDLLPTRVNTEPFQFI